MTQNHFVGKRLSMEIDTLKEMFGVDIRINPDTCTKTLCLYDDEYRVMYVKIPSSYPFHPPKLMIPNRKTYEQREYDHLYKSLSHFYLKNLEELNPKYKHNCICCHQNAICSWQPNKKILDIIDDYKKYEKWFKILKSIYCGKKILTMYFDKYTTIAILKYIHQPVPCE